MNARDQEFIKTTGQKVPVSKMSPFVGRVFALIDLVEWNATYGFLASKNLLTLNKDPELTLATPTVSGAIDFYVYSDAKHHKEVPHWGDLHYPISLPRAGTYDVSFVLPILTGLSGALNLGPWPSQKCLLHVVIPPPVKCSRSARLRGSERTLQRPALSLQYH
jgi:hypothetical protein